MKEIVALLAILAVVFGFFGVLGFLADVVAPAVLHLFPGLEARFEKFYQSLPMSGDDWDK